jgi:predicted transcriptional regulator
MIKLTNTDLEKLIKAFQEGFTQVAIAKAFGITQGRVSQILKEKGLIESRSRNKNKLDINSL